MKQPPQLSIPDSQPQQKMNSNLFFCICPSYLFHPLIFVHLPRYHRPHLITTSHIAPTTHPVITITHPSSSLPKKKTFTSVKQGNCLIPEREITAEPMKLKMERWCRLSIRRQLCDRTADQPLNAINANTLSTFAVLKWTENHPKQVWSSSSWRSHWSTS